MKRKPEVSVSSRCETDGTVLAGLMEWNQSQIWFGFESTLKNDVDSQGILKKNESTFDQVCKFKYLEAHLKE